MALSTLPSQSLSPHSSFLLNSFQLSCFRWYSFFFPAQRLFSFSFLMETASWAEAQALMHGQTLCSYLLFIMLSCFLIKVEESFSFPFVCLFCFFVSFCLSLMLRLHLFIFSSSQLLTVSWLDMHSLHRRRNSSHPVDFRRPFDFSWVLGFLEVFVSGFKMQLKESVFNQSESPQV